VSDLSAAPPRKLSRNETHDLSMIIKERTKVLRAHAEEQAAKCLADFEGKVSKIYSYDDDEVWKRATEEAMEVVKKAQEKIEDQCRKLGIPKDLSPQLALGWEGRGQMKAASRRAELRRVAKAEIDAMMKAAIVKIEKQSLDLRTQVVAMGLLTSEATLFLESLAPVEEAMHAIDFGAIETKMLEDKRKNSATIRRLGYGGLYD
jgi:vacuolar-type H+-ATPase subunit H